MLEPLRANSFLNSEDFNNTTWTKTNSTITADSVISPSGIQNADTFTGNGTSGAHSINNTTAIAVTSSSYYSYSVYCKKGTNNFVQLMFASTQFSGTAYANFDLNNGVLGTVGTGVTATIINVGNGWYRCTAIAQASGSGNNSFYINLISLATSARLESNTLTTNVYVWGAQLEVGAYPTSYIPTTSSTVTRNGDIATRNNIYTNGLITSAGGTWFIDSNNFDFNYSQGGGLEYSLFLSGVAVNSLVISISGGTAGLVFRKYTASSSTISYTIPNSYVYKNKIAISWNVSLGTIKIFSNGILVNTFTTQTFVNYETLNLTDGNSSATSVTHKVNSCLLFPSPLTDSECIALTSLNYPSYSEMAIALNYNIQ